MLTIEMFREKLASVKDATSVKGLQYTDIKLEDTVITFQRSENKRECITISELYDIYLNEDKIDTTIIKKYLSQRTQSPAYAILKATGLYDRNGKRMVSKSNPIKNLGNNTHWHQRSWFYRLFILLLHALPILAVLYAIFKLSDLSVNKNNYASLLIISIIALVSILFFRFIYLKKNNFKSTNYSAYFTLLLFSVSVLPLYHLVIDYYNRNKVRVEYTVGLRSWGSEVQYSNIQISYYDRYGNPYNLSDTLINNSTNWQKDAWINENLEQFKSHSMKFETDSLENLTITLLNCGAILRPSAFKEAAGFFMSADVKFIRADPFYANDESSGKIHSTHLCLKIPVVVDSINPGAHYYAYEFFFNDFTLSKLRIPGFNYDYINETLNHKINYEKDSLNATDLLNSINASILEIKSSSINSPFVISDSTIKISLSALLVNDYAIFNIINPKTNYSIPLFGFNINDSGSFKL